MASGKNLSDQSDSQNPPTSKEGTISTPSIHDAEAEKAQDVNPPSPTLLQIAMKIRKDMSVTLKPRARLQSSESKSKGDKSPKEKETMDDPASSKGVGADKVSKSRKRKSVLSDSSRTRSISPVPKCKISHPPPPKFQKSKNVEKKGVNSRSSKNNQIATGVPLGSGPVFDAHMFRSVIHQKLWKSFNAKTLIPDGALNMKNLLGTGIMDILVKNELANTVRETRPYVHKIVIEFYCNLSEEMFDDCSPNKFKAFVRGPFFTFSPATIDEFVGRQSVVHPDEPIGEHILAQELTLGKLSHWPSKVNLPNSDLSQKYSILHKIAVRNWLPTSHKSTVSPDVATVLYKIGRNIPFNFGNMIFNAIGKHAESSSRATAMGYPGLIYGILSSQINVLTTDDVLISKPKTIYISPRLFNEDLHIKDVGGNTQGHRRARGRFNVISRPIPPEVIISAQSTRVIQELERELIHLNEAQVKVTQMRAAIESLLYDLKHGPAAARTGDATGDTSARNDQEITDSEENEDTEDEAASGADDASSVNGADDDDAGSDVSYSFVIVVTKRGSRFVVLGFWLCV
ncbi:uncharacterized protein LOC131018407 [Salvia miltiorrhiza]|uniref:uncharacterized protein LOC131018407 n=1 Tax=Salvia miltiorrhiza TaxID=226208 RepID=UPI0025AC2E02|nr:uncharacterized protein LOC131018407 [Salvia miltiorrhiza]